MKTTTTGAKAARAPQNVPVMAVSTGLNVGSYMLFGPILSLIMRDLGATDFQVSLASGVWIGVGALFQFQGGRWGDRYGRRPVIVYPTFLAALTFLAVAWAPNWYIFALIYAGYGIANAVQGPLFSAVIGEAVEPSERGKAFGIIEFGIGIGVILGPILGARLLPTIGSSGLLMAAGVGWALSGLIRYRYLGETRPENVDANPFAFTRVFSGPLRHVTIVTVASQLLLSLTMWGPFLALHASDALLLSKQQISLYYGFSAVVSTVVSLLAGRLVSRIGPFRTMGGAAVGLALAVMLWATQRTIPGIIVGYMAMGALFQFTIVSMDAFRVAAVDERIRGSALGAMGAISGLVTAGAMPLVGSLQSSLGAMLPFWAGGAAAVAVMVSVLALHRRLGENATSVSVHGFEGFS